MKKIVFNDIQYELVRNDGDCFNYDEVFDKVTDYFEPYDYIFGDYAYGKVRLKGYYDSKNKKVKPVNDIQFLDNYVENYCTFGAKVFLLKKIK